MFQLFCLIFGAYFFNTTIFKKKTIKYLFFAISLSLLIMTTRYILKFKDSTLCSKKQKGGLRWDVYDNFTSQPKIWDVLYYGLLFFLPLTLSNKLKGAFASLFGVISFIIITHLNRRVWASRWCFASALSPFIYLLFISKYKII